MPTLSTRAALRQLANGRLVRVHRKKLELPMYVCVLCLRVYVYVCACARVCVLGGVGRNSIKGMWSFLLPQCCSAPSLRASQ